MVLELCGDIATPDVLSPETKDCPKRQDDTPCPDYYPDIRARRS